MDIKSGSTLQKTVKVTLMDIDIVLDGGVSLPITLRPEDTYDSTNDTLVVTYARTGEKVTIRQNKILWLSERVRIVEEKEPNGLKKEAA